MGDLAKSCKSSREGCCRLQVICYLVLQVGVAEGRDEDPGDAGVPVPGRGVQRGVAVLQ